MSARPRLITSIPFWVLIVGSLATAAIGAWLTLGKLDNMTQTITAGTATGVDVYVGQVWAIVGGILIATGLIGLALALVTGVVRSLLPQPVVEIVEAIDWSEDEAPVEEVEVVEVVTAEPVAEPAVETVAEPVAETTPAETTTEPTSEAAPQR